MSEPEDWEARARAIFAWNGEDVRFAEWCPPGAWRRALRLGDEMVTAARKEFEHEYLDQRNGFAAAAADARAEEIAQKIEAAPCSLSNREPPEATRQRLDAGIARSTSSEAAMDRLEEKFDEAVDKEEQEINPWTQPMRATWPREEAEKPQAEPKVVMTAHDPLVPTMAAVLHEQAAEAAIRADERKQCLGVLVEIANQLNAIRDSGFMSQSQAMRDLRGYVERAVRRWREMLAPQPKTREQVLEVALHQIFATCIDEKAACAIARRALAYKPNTDGTG